MENIEIFSLSPNRILLLQLLVGKKYFRGVSQIVYNDVVSLLSVLFRSSSEPVVGNSHYILSVS